MAAADGEVTYGKGVDERCMSTAALMSFVGDEEEYYAISQCARPPFLSVRSAAGELDLTI